MLEIQNNINISLMTPLPDLDNLPEKSYREKLLLLLKFVPNWSKFEGIGKSAALSFFMRWLGRLYLEYFQYHLDEAKACGLEHKDTLLSILDPIEEKYILDKWDYFATMTSDIDVVWLDICKVRTNIEAFQEMFGEITGPFCESAMKECREIMEANKSMAMALRSDEIPWNVPRSHWWWFYESKTTPEGWAEFYKD